MKKYFLLFIFSSFFTLFLSAQNGAYSRVKIFTDDAGLRTLSAAGIAVDHGEFKKGYCFTTDLSAAEFLKVQQLGFPYEVIIPDVQAYYQKQNENGAKINPTETTQAITCGSGPTFPTPTNFALGTMGGFFTLNEIYWHLDNMASLYPNIFKARVAIDSNITTTQGRYLFWVKISDNPNIGENEPKILYTAAHHAREPAGVSQLIMYMYYLLENYNTDPEVHYLVDHTEMFFVPCVNPDGYNYNYTTNPNGGGMWRKDRRDNLDGTFGVDLNRNYGYFWGYDNVGSSNQTNNETYRGPSPVSEPETQLMEEFCLAHQFRIAINNHTYSNVLCFPISYDLNVIATDAPTYNAWGPILTETNHYAFGNAMQTVGYTTNGDSDDWMYGDSVSKPKIIAMTPEAGDDADGFWPASNRIIPICRGNIPMDINAARLLLAYGRTHDGDGKYISQLNGYFHYDFQRLGLDSPASYTVSIQSLSSWITSVGSGHIYSGLARLQSVTDSISYSLNSAIPEGTAFSYVVLVNNGTFTWSDTITKTFGHTVILLANNGNSITGWTSTGGWGINTSAFYSTPSSIGDSPSGNYNQLANTNIKTTSPISLVGAISAQLSFRGMWALEAGYDYSQVQVSTDNGVTWTALCGKYTTNNNGLDNGNPTYTGINSVWLKEEMSLDNYLGQSILVRFRLSADFGVQYDGFNFDDLLVEAIDTTSAQGISENHLAASSISQNMPNPADDYTFINTGHHSQNGTIEIYNSIGELVMTKNVNAGTPSVQLNTTSLSVGVYFYRMVCGSEISETRKMSVVR
ncbi:MAG: M14 family zinc carboxypeptidase [Bacteroidetes bacterium]|nr:M14 family zinc carboxypeptidase [Bacteroidota bacterium]